MVMKETCDSLNRYSVSWYSNRNWCRFIILG